MCSQLENIDYIWLSIQPMMVTREKGREVFKLQI